MTDSIGAWRTGAASLTDASEGAFTFTHLHFKGDALGPQVLVFFRIFGGDGGEFLQLFFYVVRADALHKRPEDLLGLVVFFVVSEQFFDGSRNAPRGDLQRRLAEFAHAFGGIAAQEHHIL